MISPATRRSSSSGIPVALLISYRSNPYEYSHDPLNPARRLLVTRNGGTARMKTTASTCTSAPASLRRLIADADCVPASCSMCSSCSTSMAPV